MIQLIVEEEFFKVLRVSRKAATESRLNFSY